MTEPSLPELEDQRAQLYEELAAEQGGASWVGGELERVRRELAGYQWFAALSEQIVEVNEAICEVRSAAPAGLEALPAETGDEERSSACRSRRASRPS
jgi:hypothetical protein